MRMKAVAAGLLTILFPTVCLAGTILAMGDQADMSGLQALGLRVNARIEVQKFAVENIDRSKYDAIIMIAGAGGGNGRTYPFSTMVPKMRSFVKEGGRLVVMVLPLLAQANNALVDAFSLNIVNTYIKGDGGKGEMHFPGGKFTKLWDGLIVGASESRMKLACYLATGDSAAVSTAYDNDKLMSVYSRLGEGDSLWVVNFGCDPGGWGFAPYASFIYTRSLDQWDNKEAAIRLIKFAARQIDYPR